MTDDRKSDDKPLVAKQGIKIVHPEHAATFYDLDTGQVIRTSDPVAIEAICRAWGVK